MAYDLPDELLLEADGPVRYVTMNRPDHRNAVNESMHDALADVWRQLAADREAAVVVLTGAGDSFSAGGDMAFFGELRADMALRRHTIRRGREIVHAMARFHLPVIAAVNGPAVGLGCSLASLCDLVLMAENAYFADPHVAMGLVAGDGGAATWPLLMGLLHAKEYLFTGDRITATRAEHLGLCNRVVAADRLRAEASALATRLAAVPSEALQDTKRALNLHVTRAAAGVLDFACAAESEAFLSEGHSNRVAAFLEKAK